MNVRALQTRRLLFLTGVLAMLVPGRASAQTASREQICGEILRYALRDDFRMSGRSSLEAQAREWVCDAGAYERTRSLAASGSAVIEAIPISVRGSAQDFSRWQRSHCESRESSYSHESAIAIARSVLSPFAVRALQSFDQCMSQSASGMSVHIVSSDSAERFIMGLRWTYPVAPPRIASVEISPGGACALGPTIRPGHAFPREASFACTRTRDSAVGVTIIVNLEGGQGSATFLIPPIERREPPSLRPMGCVRQETDSRVSRGAVAVELACDLTPGRYTLTLNGTVHIEPPRGGGNVNRPIVDLEVRYGALTILPERSWVGGNGQGDVPIGASVSFEGAGTTGVRVHLRNCEWNNAEGERICDVRDLAARVTRE